MAREASTGFGLLELLFGLLVAAILAMMAIPSLREGTIRRQLKEGLALADLARQGVAQHYAATGEMPGNNEQAGIPPAPKIVGNFVTGVRIQDGAVTLTYGNNANQAIHGKRVTLRPAIVPEHRAVPVAWVCARVAVPGGMEIRGADATDVPANWLPVECRGPSPEKAP